MSGFDWNTPLVLLQMAHALLEKAPDFRESKDAWFHQYVDEADVMSALEQIIAALQEDQKHGR